MTRVALGMALLAEGHPCRYADCVVYLAHREILVPGLEVNPQDPYVPEQPGKRPWGKLLEFLIWLFRRKHG